MSKSNDFFNSIGRIFTYILSVLLMLGIAGMVVYFALRVQGVTYYVEYGGEKYFANSESGNIQLVIGQTHSFSVKSLTGGEVNYSVTVQSNYANNFDFVFDDKYWQFFSATDENNDYSAVFGLQKKTDGFSLTLPDCFSVEQAIEEKYGGEVVLLNDYEINTELCYFVIVIASGDSTVSLPFSLYVKVEGISLDPSQIIF